jgi:hypothetical protein
MTSHEDLGIVLVQSTLIVTNSWHIFDDDSVVRVLALLVENRVGFNHVIHDIGLGDFLGAELLLGAQVLPIIVTKVVVAGNGSELDTSADQEIDQSRLHLGLTGLEIITANERIVLLSKFNSTRNKGILRRTIDEGDALENTSHSKDSGWSYFLVTVCNSLYEILRNEICEALSVGGPLNNDLVQIVRGLEVAARRVSISFSCRFDNVHTGYPCESAQHAPCKPCYPSRGCRHDPPDWQQ